MRILGRQYTNVSELTAKAFDLARMFFRSLIFKNCVSLWRAYIKQKSPPANKFQIWNGCEIILSENPHDSITVMVIFCRREYGKVLPGATVVDVGANVGVFSLFAAYCGAKKVYSFEPNKQSYDVLLENIKNNKLEHIIVPFNRAVGPTDGELIAIPKESSPYNKTVNANATDPAYDIVETVSLPSFIRENKIAKIDFLKMDCEGAEYSIIYSMRKEDFDLIETFRLENHNSNEKKKLVDFMRQQGLRKTHERNLIIWFDRQAAASPKM